MFQTILIDPIYNVFIFLTGLMPYGDAGLAIIATVLLTRIILYPVFISSIRSQMNMSAMQVELEATKHKYEHDKDALAKHQMELVRKYKVNPLSILASIVVQFGLLISLYIALFREGFPHINEALLYPFVHAPAAISTTFFGLINLLTPHHVVLAVLVGLTQYAALHLTIKRTPTTSTGDKAATQKAQQQVMQYFMPVMVGILSYFFAGAVGLYFLAGNLVSLSQELIVRRHLAN
ncbi:MAG TPA: YidC/Oxa1 family membrane protein insertase [Candidatus Paceibacterota bacterium]